jgi:hypothetical protein
MTRDTTSENIEVTIRESTANYFSGVVFVIATIVFGVPFALIWSWQALVAAFRSFLSHYLFLFLAIIIGMVLHEALHGFTWARFCRNGVRSIRYGMKWQALAPYAQCNETLPIRAYRLGCVMPGVVLGIIPALIAVVIGNSWLLGFGIFFTAGAAGDFLILLNLRSFNTSYDVLDHPEKIGCLVSKSSRLKK